MPVTTLMPLPKQQFLSQLGIPLVGGKVYTYAAGTNNPKATYTDAAGTIAQANPIQLNVRGEPASPIYWSGAYKVEVRDALGNVVYTVDNFSTDPAGLWGNMANLAAAAGASLIGFIQAGAGAVKRWIQDKLRECVSVEDFGAVGDGVADDTAAILAALASFGAIPGTLFFTKSLYKISAPVLVSLSGMRLIGKSPLGCYLMTDNGKVFDLVRVAGSNVEVSGFIFRPGNGAQRCLYVYGSRAHIHHNRFLAGNPGNNTAILLSSTDPNGVSSPGAYNHCIEWNEIGLAGYHFAIGVDQDGITGQQANTFLNNKIVGDLCIKTRSGGANTYIGNLLQSNSGTYAAPVGNGFDFDAGVVGEMVFGNYIERFQFGIICRNNTAYSGGSFGPNHNDNNTTDIYFTAKGNSFYIDAQNGVARWNEWQILPAWNSNWRLKSGFYANNSIEVKSTVNSVQVNGHGVYAESRPVATGATITPDIGAIKTKGNGAPAAGLTLAPGYYDGQILYLIGDSWPATYLATNCVFGAAGAPTFGNAAGQVASMTLMYSSGENKWYEMARVVR